jgi:hypothetical protein
MYVCKNTHVHKTQIYIYIGMQTDEEMKVTAWLLSAAENKEKDEMEKVII